jgi:hypothetical protein
MKKEKSINEKKASQIYKCCRCNTIHKGWGNNPAPLVNDGKSRCCDKCNEDVIAYRILCALTGGSM